MPQSTLAPALSLNSVEGGVKRQFLPVVVNRRTMGFFTKSSWSWDKENNLSRCSQSSYRRPQSFIGYWLFATNQARYRGAITSSSDTQEMVETASAERFTAAEEDGDDAFREHMQQTIKVCADRSKI